MTLKVLYNYYEQRVHGIRLNFLERSYLTDIAQPVKSKLTGPSIQASFMDKSAPYITNNITDCTQFVKQL